MATQVIQGWRTALDKAASAYSTAAAQAKALQGAVAANTARCKAAAAAQTLTQSIAQQVQTLAHKRIASIVTTCLACFAEPYTFHIQFNRTRGRTAAALTFKRNGQTLESPLTAAGGGCIDVAAFALRTACATLHNPPIRRLLILDEPLKHLSAAYRPRMRKVLDTISHDLSMQIILVTHDPALQTGSILQLE